MATDFEMLDALIVTSRQGGAAGAIQAFEALLARPGGPDQLELTYPDAATERLQRIYGDVLFGLLNERTNPGALLLVSQFMKGRRYGAIASSGVARTHVTSAEEQALLSAQLDQYDGSWTFLIDNDLLVTPLTSDAVEVEISFELDEAKRRRKDERSIQSAGTLAQHRYTEYLAGALAEESARAQPVLLDETALTSALDEETVLVDLILVEQPERSVLVAGIWTKEAHGTAAQFLPPEPALMRLRVDGLRVQSSTVAVAVRDLRNAINPIALADQELDDDQIARAAKPIVENTSSLLTQLLSRHLPILHRQGKRHLCIVPHGPLRVVPFHLLEVAGRLLSDDWIVTSLPNLSLLPKQPADPRKARDGLAVFGLGYQHANPFGLPALPEAVAEAEEIARAAHQTPVPEKEATRSAFLDALGQYRFVHLAAHGAANATGPAFHVVYLSADGAHDGRVFAHELLGHDLRGLELVTLSACETALGRFDRGDNLFGFPAMFLAVGVECVIGTLWDVGSQPARTFFTSLYNDLHSGRPRRQAFLHAQQVTRAQHPQQRDWGAFWYMGR